MREVYGDGASEESMEGSRVFFGFYKVPTLFNNASSTTPQTSLCQRMLRLIEPGGLLRLGHSQSDALTTQLDLISQSGLFAHLL